MSKSKKKKETKAVIAGQIAFWVSFLGIISLPIPGFWRFVGGFAIASGLKKLIETIRRKVVVPMDYRMGKIGLPNVAQVDDFLSLVEDYVYYPTDTLTINEGTKSQIAVLSYKSE